MQNIFDAGVTAQLIQRINQIQPNQRPLWGTMSASQMLAHCNVSYEMVYDNKHKAPNGFKRFVLKLLVKPMVVNEKPYKKSSMTAPEFIIKTDKDFNLEKARLVEYLQRTQQLGPTHFEGRSSLSFGSMTSGEWNNLFYKHLDHHLQQFGV